jgi:hypothetical protein
MDAAAEMKRVIEAQKKLIDEKVKLVKDSRLISESIRQERRGEQRRIE